MVRESCSEGVEVALLIDFWNLVHGVENDVDCGALYWFAREYGRVATAKAYADWGDEEVSGYQAALRGVGVEPVQVPVRSDRAHGVCIKMGVDAVNLAWSAPQVGVYVIVAADGGLFPAEAALRRRGRKVVGVWLAAAVRCRPGRAIADDRAPRWGSRGQ